LDEVRLGSRTLHPWHHLLVNGRREPLGRRALEILSVLADARGEVVSKDTLLEAVWPGIVVEENALQVHVVALRKALGPEADRLQTIRGVGYRLELDSEPPAQAGPAAAPARPSQTVSNGARLRALWPDGRAPRLALAFGGLLLVLAGVWAAFGDELGLRQQDRIPVVVHVLAATTGADPTEAGLGRGITDELISRLRRVPELRIATAARDGAVPDGGFGNAYAVDGTIRRDGDRLRVTARLIDARGEIRWSETFDRNLVDLFDVQEKIAAAIASELSVSFDVGVNSTRYGGTDNPEAYAAYMQFWAHNADFDPSIANRYLEQAARLDPEFGKVLYGLAANYGTMALASSPTEAVRLLARQDEVSAQALAAHPDSWFGHMARVMFDGCRGNFRAVDEHMRRAAQLDSGDDPQLRAQLAASSIWFGRLQRALALRRSLAVIDPIYADAPVHVYDLMFAGRYQDSIDLHARLEREGDAGAAQFAYQVFFAHLLLGSEADAVRFAEQRNLPFGDMLAAFRADKALLTMSDAELRRSQEGQVPSVIGRVAHLAAYDGHPQLAVRLMRIAFDRPGGPGMLQALWHPAMAEARTTDEFERLVTDIGLVEFWRESGEWNDFCRPVSATEIACR
jgi:DNA-binding winged helix-turn-helix (wHTH) protein/TolB-like protein